MRRIQIHIDDRMDDDLASEARRRGMSKAALIRLLLSQRRQIDHGDPIDDLIGAGDRDAADDIDAIVYGR